MANTNNPFGLKEWGMAAGGAPTFEIGQALVASTNGTKIYYQDMLKRLNTGYVAQWTAGTAVSQFIGTFLSCKYLSTSQGRIVNSPYWPGADATGDVTVYYVPANLAIPPRFLAQTDSTGAVFGDIGANVDIVVGTGSTSGRAFSGSYIDMSTSSTGATLPLRITNLYTDYNPVDPNGTATGAYNWVIVTANVSGGGSTGI